MYIHLVFRLLDPLKKVRGGLNLRCFHIHVRVVFEYGETYPCSPMRDNDYVQHLCILSFKFKTISKSHSSQLKRVLAQLF